MLPSTQPTPPRPTYIFRAHQAAIHALHFFHHAQEHYFVSGDGDGYIIVWRLLTRRPIAVWKAHEGGISGLKTWKIRKHGETTLSNAVFRAFERFDDTVEIRLISHGRDHRLRVWRLDLHEWQEGSGSDTTDGDPRFLIEKLQAGQNTDNERIKQPWLLHSMAVNALNFCAFAVCSISAELLLASPNGLDSSTIDVFHLPSEQRVSQVRSSTNQDGRSTTGMVMCVELRSESTDKLTLLAGYEDGSVQVFQRENPGSTDPRDWTWQMTGRARVHSQPVLAVTSTPDAQFFFTSSADAVITKFAIPASSPSFQVDRSKPGAARTGDIAMTPSRTVNTKHAGQQDLKVRADGKIIAMAGWDGMIRVFSVKSLKELAVLAWHSVGCYAVAFAEIERDEQGRFGGYDESRARSVGRLKECVERERVEKMYETHWLVAGSKDGKISLWDVY